MGTLSERLMRKISIEENNIVLTLPDEADLKFCTDMSLYGMLASKMDLAPDIMKELKSKLMIKGRVMTFTGVSDKAKAEFVKGAEWYGIDKSVIIK